jgi:hypothetical protein
MDLDPMLGWVFHDRLGYHAWVVFFAGSLESGVSVCSSIFRVLICLAAWLQSRQTVTGVRF